jgi:hypothetical protein
VLGDHGNVRLFDERIGWTLNGVAHERPLDDIAEIRLSSVPAFMCQIRCRNTNGLRVFASDAQLYGEFVKDLHSRLFFGALERPPIKFTCPRDRPLLGLYLSIAIAGILAPLLIFGIGGKSGRPVRGLLLPDPPRIFPLLGFISLCVAFGVGSKVVQLLTPIKYDPSAIPDSLLPAG